MEELQPAGVTQEGAAVVVPMVAPPHPRDRPHARYIDIRDSDFPQTTRKAKVTTILFRRLKGLPLWVPGYDLNPNPWFPVLTMDPHRELMSVLLTMIELPVSAKQHRSTKAQSLNT